MIHFALFLEASHFKPADYVFARSLAAHASMSSGTATVDSRSGLKLEHKVLTDISWAAPTDIYAAVTEQGTKREIFIGKYDVHIRRPDLQQYKKEKKDDKYELVEAARYTDSSLDKLALSLLQEKTMAQFFQDYEQVPKWRLDVKNGQVKLSSKVGVVTYEFDFDATTWRLERHLMKTSMMQQAWTVNYHPTRRPAKFKPGPQDYQVAGFEAPMQEPKYADAATKQVVAKLFRAYDRPGWLAFEVQDGGDKTVVLLKGRNLRQVTKNTDFVYDGSRLAVMDRTQNTFYAGATKSKDLSKTLAAADARIDPFVQLLVRGVNPFRYYCSRDAKAKIVGTTQAKGEKVVLIEIESNVDRMNVAMRASDGKVLSIMTQVTSHGSNMATQRVFNYLPKSEVDRNDAFLVQAESGATKKPVEALVAQA